MAYVLKKELICDTHKIHNGTYLQGVHKSLYNGIDKTALIDPVGQQA